MGKALLFVLLMILIAGGGWLWYGTPKQTQPPAVNTNIGNEFEKQDLIKVSQPRPNTTVTSPLTVKGEARGKWFFDLLTAMRHASVLGTGEG